MVPMTFSLRVPTDGHGVSASDVSTRFLEGLTDIKTVYKQIRENPVEYNLTPSGGVLLPLSGAEIQVICFVLLSTERVEKAEKFSVFLNKMDRRFKQRHLYSLQKLDILFFQ